MRALPDDNLCYPVCIELSNGSFGSGFLLNTGQTLFLGTAKHVLFDRQGALVAQSATGTSFTSDLTSRAAFNLDLALLEANGEIRQHATADVAVIKLADKNPTHLVFLPGTTLTMNEDGGKIVGIAAQSCRPFEKALVANDVFLFGYPRALGDGSNQVDRGRPLLRKGIIADKDPVKRHIVIDCPVYQGNSGGIVLEAYADTPFERKFGAIGIATSFVPFVEELQSRHYGTTNVSIENSGYAVVTPIDRVLELVGQELSAMAA